MKTSSYKKRRNMSIIQLSPEFNEEVKIIRSGLGLPLRGLSSNDKRMEWYKEHHKENTRLPYKPLPDYYWHFPREFIDLLESFSYSSISSKVNYYPDVPLDHYSMELIQKFDLPEEYVNQIKSYILGQEKTLAVLPALQSILIPMDKGSNYMVLVSGISEESTQKDWLEVWKSIENVLHLSGIGKIAHKRPVDNLLLRDLYFWEQVKKGKKAREVADEWLSKHPEDKGYPVEDMIRKAVKRIEKIMAPDA